MYCKIQNTVGSVSKVLLTIVQLGTFSRDFVNKYKYSPCYFPGWGRATRDLHPSCNTLYLSSPRLCFFIVI